MRWVGAEQTNRKDRLRTPPEAVVASVQLASEANHSEQHRPRSD